MIKIMIDATDHIFKAFDGGTTREGTERFA